MMQKQCFACVDNVICSLRRWQQSPRPTAAAPANREETFATAYSLHTLTQDSLTLACDIVQHCCQIRQVCCLGYCCCQATAGWITVGWVQHTLLSGCIQSARHLDWLIWSMLPVDAVWAEPQSASNAVAPYIQQRGNSYNLSSENTAGVDQPLVPMDDKMAVFPMTTVSTFSEHTASFYTAHVAVRMHPIGPMIPRQLRTIRMECSPTLDCNSEAVPPTDSPTLVASDDNMSCQATDEPVSCTLLLLWQTQQLVHLPQCSLAQGTLTSLSMTLRDPFA